MSVHPSVGRYNYSSHWMDFYEFDTGGLLLKSVGKVQVSLYLLTPWSRVLLERLTGSQLVKKFPAFYGT
jgi:hypothetical protein